MVKHTQTILRQQPKNCLSMFYHFVGLAFKGLLITISCFILRFSGYGWWDIKLNHFMSFVSFYTPRKYQKIRGILIFSVGIEREQPHKNGLISAYSSQYSSIIQQKGVNIDTFTPRIFMYQYFLETHQSGGTAGLGKSNFYSTDFPFFLAFHKQALTHTEAYLGSCQFHTMVLFIKIVKSS